MPLDFNFLFEADMDAAFFVSLAVKTKLHLDRPRDEGFDCEELLNYYNQFPTLPQYSSIKPRHFRLKNVKPWRMSKRNGVIFDPEKLTFGTLDEELDMDGLSNVDDDKNNDNDNDNNNFDGY